MFMHIFSYLTLIIFHFVDHTPLAELTCSCPEQMFIIKNLNEDHKVSEVSII